MEIPQVEHLVRDFAERHHMQTGERLAREVLPIRAVSLANILITAGEDRSATTYSPTLP